MMPESAVSPLLPPANDPKPTFFYQVIRMASMRNVPKMKRIRSERKFEMW